MAVLFLDSSAVAKRYVIEGGSQWVHTLLDPDAGNELHVSVLAGVEVIAALTRRRRAGTLDANSASIAIDEFLDDWKYLFSHAVVDERLIERAIDLAKKHELRGYDAVQLATAMVLNDRYKTVGTSLTLVSADDELNTAAMAEGLDVENPNLHT